MELTRAFFANAGSGLNNRFSTRRDLFFESAAAGFADFFAVFLAAAFLLMFSGGGNGKGWIMTVARLLAMQKAMAVIASRAVFSHLSGHEFFLSPGLADATAYLQSQSSASDSNLRCHPGCQLSHCEPDRRPGPSQRYDDDASALRQYFAKGLNEVPKSKQPRERALAEWLHDLCSDTAEVAITMKAEPADH